jgi:hypothetical protein
MRQMAAVARDREKQQRHVNDAFRLRFIMSGPAALEDRAACINFGFISNGEST